MLACLRLAALSAGLRARASAQHRERRKYPAASLALASPRQRLQRMHALQPPPNALTRAPSRSRWLAAPALSRCFSPPCLRLLRFLAVSSLSFALSSLRCLVWLLSPSRGTPGTPRPPRSLERPANQANKARHETKIVRRSASTHMGYSEYSHGSSEYSHGVLDCAFRRSASAVPP
jgi:hypothetical protein